MGYYNLIPDMTSSTTPSGVASASSEDNSSAAAYKAMDSDDTGTFWAPGTPYTAPYWIQYKFDTAEASTGYTIIALTDPSTTPNTWTLEASNTGAFSGEETILDTQSGVTWTTRESKSFYFSNTTPYLYYRLNITSNNGSSWGVYMAGFRLLAVAPNVASLTASVSISAKQKAINRSTLTASVALSADGERRKYSHEFLFVGEIQLAHIIKTFHFVAEIEQPSQAMMIQRVNI